MNDKTEGQGREVTLPNGDKRIEYIRNAYYDKKTGKHEEGCTSRSDIRKAINEMLAAAGREDEQITYQIVFSATKTAEDPRVAAAQRATERAAAKAEKDAAKEAEKAAAAAAKTEDKPAPAAAAGGKKAASKK